MTEHGLVRVRFAPSPSGDLHVGNVRTALYDWAFARSTGGTFVLRIEDTDRSRVTAAYIGSAQGTLRWLGLDWDEGPGIGGPYGPYLQSERLDIYTEWVDRFLKDGYAYYCYCTPEELAERREAARQAGGPSGYDGHCRDLTPDQAAAYEAAGRQPVARFRMPSGSTTFTDLIRGPVTFDHAHVPDFTLTRSGGAPLYTLAVAVDDVLMKITHVVRGEDLLSSTPRQIAVYRAMGVTEDRFPVFAHLPYVLGPNGQKLSKRNGVVSINWYREQGFLPEAICNYLALLGWSPGENREEFTMAEMAAEFDLAKVNKNAAQFDVDKLRAINGDKIRALAPADFAGRITPFLAAGGLVADPPTGAEAELIAASAPLIQTRVTTLAEAPGMLGFLFVGEAEFTADPDDAARSLTADAEPVLTAAEAALAGLEPWTYEAIEAALRAALVDGLGLKPRAAFSGALRVAVTGKRSGPPLFQSIALLGRERTLRRLASARAIAAGNGGPVG
ncbi:MAG TPA: glutamate--tRNA ligase [Streptosporangiaceae bacterium]|nr:glutamate--tRNA ligase [Streptosporangiaceae bacterium]